MVKYYVDALASPSNLSDLSKTRTDLLHSNWARSSDVEPLAVFIAP